MYSLSKRYSVLFPMLLFLIIILISKLSLFQSSKEISIGITLDLILTIPLIYFITIRKSKIPKTSFIPVFILGLVTGSVIIPEQDQGLLNFVKEFIVPVIEFFAICYIIYNVRKIRKAYKSNKNELSFSKALKIAVKDILPDRFASVLVSEISMIYYCIFAWKNSLVSDFSFTYHRKSGIVPFLSILIFLILFETVLIHIVIQIWSSIAAWILTIVNLYALIQITAILRSIKKLPIKINHNYLEINFGIFSETIINLDNIESVENGKRSFKKSDAIVSVSPFSELIKPNILIKLKEEEVLTKLYGFKTSYKQLVFNVDDVETFTNSIKNSTTIPNPSLS